MPYIKIITVNYPVCYHKEHCYLTLFGHQIEKRLRGTGIMTLMTNHTPVASESVSECYLCGEMLGADTTFDHIIPDELFIKNDPYRPKLCVHQKCNNLKSKDDEWFVKQLQIRCSINPEAEREVSRLVDKANMEKPDAYLIGKRLHNYKLAMGIFNDVTWGWELRYKGQSLMQMQISKKDTARFRRYVETMCRGLFIRNVPLSKPANIELIQSQYPYAELKGKDVHFVNAIKNLLDASRGSIFGQQWGNKITYVGSRVKETPNKGFVFVQFYSQFGILAVFK